MNEVIERVTRLMDNLYKMQREDVLTDLEFILVSLEKLENESDKSYAKGSNYYN